MKIKEMEMGTGRLSLLLLSVGQKETKTGNPFVTLMLTDGDDQVKAIMWDKKKEDMEAYEKKVLAVTLAKETYNGAVSYKAISFCVDADADIADFIPKAPYPAEKMYGSILKIAGSLGEDVAKLTLEILSENKEELLYWSAAKGVHHNCHGGLLYHMYRMSVIANALAKMYPAAIRDYLVAGATLHDIGKLKELETDALGSAEYTVDGMLFGHAFLGAEMVKEAAKRSGTPEEAVRNICHIIASHHGKQEWGALIPPQTLEAELVHHIDMIDSRAYQYESELKELEPCTVSDKLFGLGHRVYAPQAPGMETVAQGKKEN